MVYAVRRPVKQLTVVLVCPCCQTGEVWEEIWKELEAEGVEPVAFDQSLLQEISQITEAKAEQVLEAQVSRGVGSAFSHMYVRMYVCMYIPTFLH